MRTVGNHKKQHKKASYLKNKKQHSEREEKQTRADNFLDRNKSEIDDAKQSFGKNFTQIAMPNPQSKQESENKAKPVPVDLYPWLQEAEVKGNSVEHLSIVKDVVH